MRQQLAHNVKVALGTWFLIAGMTVGFTTIGFDNHYKPQGGSSSDDAGLAYQTALYQAAQNGHRFPAAKAVAAQIERQHPQFYARAGSEVAAVRYLRHHNGAQGTLFVVPRTDNRVELVARHKHDSLDVLVGDTHGKTQERTIVVGQWKWHPYDVVAGLEAGGLLALALLIAWLAAAGSGSEVERERASWAQYVPADCAYGPVEPELGFTILNAACIDHLGEPWFTTEQLTYKGSWWRRDDEELRQTITNPDGSKVEKVHRAGRWLDYTPLPDELRAVRVDPTASPEEIAAEWFRFCSDVAAWNARCWQLRQDRDLRLQQAKELAQTPLGEILPPGHEMVRGLAIEPKA